jgi:tripartite-type tricarboxylate transporter receptor subunit TctC
MLKTTLFSKSLCAATVAATLLAATSTAHAQAQAFPAKPIRFIVPLTPGGSNDVIARTIAERLQAAWHQPVVVENRPGAGGNIGADVVAKSAGDPYTWLLAPSNIFGTNPHVSKQPFDALRDFTPVMQLANVAFVLTVPVAVEVKNVSELIALAKSKPNTLNYGSAGNGQPQHLGAEMLKSMAGIEMTHVPYKGAVPAVTDLLSSRIQVWIGATNSTLPHIQAGKLRALAAAGSKRVSSLPDLPTMAEAGVPGYALDIWLSLALPAGVPADIVAKINTDVTRALDTPELRQRFAAQGIDIVLTNPSELSKLIRDDHDRWGKLIRAAGIKGD